MAFLQPTPGERLRAAVPTAAIVALLGYALVAGLAIRPPAPGDERSLAVFMAAPPPPPPEPVEKRQAQSHKREGRAAPPNLRAKPAEVVAPKPIVPLPVPPPVIVAPIAGQGMRPTAGAAPTPGPGTGAGGAGNGLGSGGDGDGDGDGGDETPPRHVRGRIKASDYPRGAALAGAGGIVSVRYHVEVDGRATDCRVTRSSGNADLDDTTCRLIEERFRYEPSRDAAGRPVVSTIVENHEWDFDDADRRR